PEDRQRAALVKISASASLVLSATNFACCSSNASELRKIRPRTTCLYLAASIEPRRASASARAAPHSQPWQRSLWVTVRCCFAWPKDYLVIRDRPDPCG